MFLFNCHRNSNIFKKKPVSLSVVRNYSTPKESKESRDNNEPVKYFGSKAASFRAREGRAGTIDYDEIPWFQTYSVVGSTAIFMLYFFVLREENDMDRDLEMTLFERVPGMEETQLIINYKYNLENKIDNGPIIARMKELGMKYEDIS